MKPVAMTAERVQETGFAERMERQSRSFHRAIPSYLAVPVAFWAAFAGFGVTVDWSLFGIGALGWWIALVLRAPVALIAKRQPQERGKWLMVGASGPLEEGIRVAAIVLLAPTLPGALSLGLGWAAIEVLFTIVNGLVVARLLRRDDEQARQARELLEAQGTLSDAGPWLGVVERVFASLLHIGFTLVLAAAPVLVLLAAPLHSAVNLLALRLTPRIGRVLAMLAVVGAVTFLVGLLLMGVGP